MQASQSDEPPVRESPANEPSAAVIGTRRSLYRRHRPRTFGEVVGQEAVVRTLRNAVERDKVHHAYLLVGSRGTGKTSMAKILAACLNCERGRSTEPCGVCASCRSIAEATSLDVVEMDAASNNSVEDIRELRESASFAPLSGRTKVYILDEAHMLSTAAWNAFLKTLEEPPPNTVFVLATTEAQKVPATVVDRCHRFDFQRPTVDQVAAVIERTAKAEGIVLPPEAVAAVAKSAGGSFRDALGTLEQLVTYSGNEVALEDALAVLGVADGRLIEGAVDAVAAGDGRGALMAVEECVRGGRDVGMFAADLERRCRELMVVQVLGEVPAELSLTDQADERLAEQAGRVDHGAVVRLLDLLGVAVQAVRAGADARTQVELALVKAAVPQVDSSVRALLARIERLEAGGGGAAPPVRIGGSSAAVNEPPIGGSTVSTETANGSLAADRVENGSAAADRVENGSAAADPVENGSGEADGGETGNGSAVADRGGAVDGAATAGRDGREPVGAVGSELAGRADSIEAIVEVWPAVVEMVRSGNALLGAVMDDAQPVELSGLELTIAFPKGSSFNKRKAEGAEHRAAVSEAIAALTGTRLSLLYELRDDLEVAEEGTFGGGDEEAMVRRIIAELNAEEIPSEESSQQGA